MRLILVFLAVPLIEIALFIQLGGVIGLWPTLMAVVMTAVLGAWLVRTQGLQAIRRLRDSLDEMRNPAEPLIHGAMILFAGALLLTPGFFTDAVGFLLLVPAFRAAVWHHLQARVRIRGHSTGDQERPDIVEGEFHEVSSGRDPASGGSSWTGH